VADDEIVARSAAPRSESAQEVPLYVGSQVRRLSLIIIE